VGVREKINFDEREEANDADRDAWLKEAIAREAENTKAEEN
jgi:hypothetical protein